MCLEDLARLGTLPRRSFGPLISKRERRLANERKYYLRLAAFVNILKVIATLCDLGGRQRVHVEIDVVYYRLALLLLV